MVMSKTIANEIVCSVMNFPDRLALADGNRQISYSRLGQYVSQLGPFFESHKVIGVYGVPSLAMAASALACVIYGRPFVHLDPAMPQMVLHNILSELKVSLIITCEAPTVGKLPKDCVAVEAEALLAEAPSAYTPLVAAPVAPTDPIYLVATSGTTGRPKCIPVSQDAAMLSYEWRDSYTPYTPDTRVGIYVFAIWEMFRPLRKGASLWFPDAGTLFAPASLADFLIQNQIDEMLFTPSFYDTFLNALPPEKAVELPLSRVILNGEVVSDDLIAASLSKLPHAALWNLYSICETHDICIAQLTEPAGGRPASVGRPMQHLRAVILDDEEAVCAPGTSGQLYFEGPRMLGSGYVNRPEETRLRFREIDLEGRRARLYDTGDQAWQDVSGALFIEGRIAHMLKLRGFSIQTRELTETMRERLDFSAAAPWVAEVGERGKNLIFYFAANAAQATRNAAEWGIEFGTNRIPPALANALRDVLPQYCIPTYFVQMEMLPLHPVSGKTDVLALPEIKETITASHLEDTVILAAARAMSCAPTEIDPATSFHHQGGDSLMCVNFMLDLEKAYGIPIDFDLAMNVPLHRIDQLMSRESDAILPPEDYDRPGILLTGATGFLGGHVLAQAAQNASADEVVYCLVRDKNRAARDRLDAVAETHGVDRAQYVIVHGTLDTPEFGLPRESYNALGRVVHKVVHCAAMVNLAIGRQDMLDWSARGISNVLDFCLKAEADLRFTSSTAVFPDRGGPWPEQLAVDWAGCTGYGAAKIAAEAAICGSGVDAAIVRLPSLYDLSSPNPKDIYEIILKASSEVGKVPNGLTFPMVDVRGAASFLLGDITKREVPFYNLIPDRRVSPQDLQTVPAEEWLTSAGLETGIARLIADFPETLCADAQFDNTAARLAWEKLSDQPFEANTNTRALLEDRIGRYQGEPAFISKSDMVKARAASLAK